MKGIIIGPRGCGKTVLINKVWFKTGDVIVDPFNEHGEKGKTKDNVFNLKEIPAEELVVKIEKFLSSLPSDFTGTVFIDSADCFTNPNSDWLIPFFNAEKYKKLNIVVVCQNRPPNQFYIIRDFCDVKIEYKDSPHPTTGKWDLQTFTIKDINNSINYPQTLRVIEHFVPKNSLQQLIEKK